MQAHDPYRDQNRKSLLWLLGGVGALIVVVAFGVGAGWLKLFGAAAPAATQVKSTPPQVVMQDTVEPPAPVLHDTDLKMPKDIHDWLMHLERIERERKRLATAQMAHLSVVMTKLSLKGATDILKSLNEDPEADPVTPSDSLVKDTEAKREEWAKLQENFASLAPPRECQAAATAYHKTLDQTSAMMIEVLDLVAGSQENPEKAIEALTNMQGTSAERIDVSGKLTDEEVAAICAKYNTRKWFSIQEDFGSGMMNQIPKMPGM